MDRRALAIAALLALLAAAVFGRAAGFGFIPEFDDGQYVVDNPQVRAGLTPAGAVWAFTSVGRASNWHPLTWLSHMLDVRLFGLDARGHHAVSVALHAANAALLFLVLRAMTGALLPSALAAALFAVHPLRAESVAWVAERKDVLSTLFLLLALGAHLRYARRPSPARYAAVALALALGLMAKPMLVTLPFLLLLLDLWPLGRVWPGTRGAAAAAARLVLEKVPLLLIAWAAATLAVVAQRRGGSLANLAALPLADRVANALVSYLAYLRSTFWPSGLSPFYPYERLALSSPGVVLAVAILSAATVATARSWRRAPWLAAGWLWFVGTLVPVVGLVQIGDQSRADRYSYATTIGLLIGAVWGATALRRRHSVPLRLLAPAAITLVAALTAVAALQTSRWRDGVTLFSQALALEPRNWIAHNNLGVALRNRGHNDEALAHFAQAVALRPPFADARYNLGVALYDLGRLDEAAAQYREVIRLKPGYDEAHCNLGAILFQRGDIDGALARFRDAVRLRPDDPVARRNLEAALREHEARAPGRR